MNKIFVIIECGYINEFQYEKCVGFFLNEDQAKLFCLEFTNEDDRCMSESRIIYNDISKKEEYKNYKDFLEAVFSEQKKITNKYFPYDYSENSRYRRYHHEEIEKFNLDKEYAILKLQK